MYALNDWSTRTTTRLKEVFGSVKLSSIGYAIVDTMTITMKGLPLIGLYSGYDCPQLKRRDDTWC